MHQIERIYKEPMLILLHFYLNTHYKIFRSLWNIKCQTFPKLCKIKCVVHWQSYNSLLIIYKKQFINSTKDAEHHKLWQMQRCAHVQNKLSKSFILRTDLFPPVLTFMAPELFSLARLAASPMFTNSSRSRTSSSCCSSSPCTLEAMLARALITDWDTCLEKVEN